MRQPVVGQHLDRLLGRFGGLVGLALALLDAGLGLVERLDRRLEGGGQPLPERFGRLTRVLGQRDHVAGVIVRAGEAGRHRESLGALGEGRIDQEPRLDVFGQGHGERRTQNGVLRVAVLGEGVVHLRLLDDGVVPAHDVLHLFPHAGPDRHRRRRIGRREREGVGDHESGRAVDRRGLTTGSPGNSLRSQRRGHRTTEGHNATRRDRYMPKPPQGIGPRGPATAARHARVRWAKRDSNPRHPACKAGALNQLSYSPGRRDPSPPI